MRENTRCNRHAHIPSCTSREKQGNRHSQYSSSKRHHLYWRALPPSSPFPVSQISTPPHSFAVCVSQSLRCQACLQSGSSLLLCRALLAHWKLAIATQIHAAHQKPPALEEQIPSSRGAAVSPRSSGPPASLPPSFGSGRVQYMYNEEAIMSENSDIKFEINYSSCTSRSSENRLYVAAVEALT
jgi:hypothetical protein